MVPHRDRDGVVPADVQIVVRVPFGLQRVLDELRGMALSASVHGDLRERVWKSCQKNDRNNAAAAKTVTTYGTNPSGLNSSRKELKTTRLYCFVTSQFHKLGRSPDEAILFDSWTMWGLSRILRLRKSATWYLLVNRIFWAPFRRLDGALDIFKSRLLSTHHHAHHSHNAIFLADRSTRHLARDCRRRQLDRVFNNFGKETTINYYNQYDALVV
jgi:hypothetical protein